MNHSYSGLIFVLIVISVYAFYSSNSEYVSDIKEKYHYSSPKTGYDSKTRWKRSADKSVASVDNVTTPGDLNLWRNDFIFNICCGRYQLLNATTNECIDVNTTEASPMAFVLNNFVVNSNMGRGVINSPQFVYGTDILDGCGNGEIVSKYK